MARVVIKAFSAMSFLVVAFCVTEVLAQTHHVVGGNDGWSSDLDVSSWLDGRVFRVGDKIWFRSAAAEDTVAELQSLEEFISRYFTSGNMDNCKNGMKLPVPVQPSPYEPAPPSQPEPSPPIQPEPPFQPEPVPIQPPSATPPQPLPPIEPEPPVVPTPPEPVPVQPPSATPPQPFPPIEPEPPVVPTPPEPVPVHPPPATPPTSAATSHSNVLSFVYCGLLLSYLLVL